MINDNDKEIDTSIGLTGRSFAVSDNIPASDDKIVISQKGIHRDAMAKVNYSLAKEAIDPDGQIIKFNDVETAIMNTLDMLKDEGREYVSIDGFIREMHSAEGFKPTPEHRIEVINTLIKLSLLTGARIDEESVTVGALIPIQLHIQLKVNGKDTDGIKILGHTCIHGVDVHSIECWRLNYPNPRMKKTYRNITISRRVLVNYLNGDNVDISDLCEALGAEGDARRDVIQTVLQCINFQRGKTTEPNYICSDPDGSGRPSIKAISTK